MHNEAKAFTVYVKNLFPAYFSGTTVLDVGSGDINGNNRFLFDDTCEYHGNDVFNAPNVTIVSKTSALPFEDGKFDMIISTECFEHDPEYAQSWRKIYDMLKPGGLFAFTCASDGRPEHGTRRTTPQDSYGTLGNVEGWTDYYLNLNLASLQSVFNLPTEFTQWKSYYNSYTKDLYFWGVKPGGEQPQPPILVPYSEWAPSVTENTL
jgi:SAM-dependent methyltransferase